MTTKKKALPFWRTKKLQEMTKEEWESLCDGCARCCLLKLENVVFNLAVAYVFLLATTKTLEARRWR